LQIKKIVVPLRIFLNIFEMDKSNEQSQQDAADLIYDYAANLMINEKKSAYETKNLLVKQGLDTESASVVVNTLENQINKAQKERANKDMLYGALWCIGGTVATLANLGYIFWGAIVFGAVQFIRGAYKSINQ
jgi:hypothetical protein